MLVDYYECLRHAPAGEFEETACNRPDPFIPTEQFATWRTQPCLPLRNFFAPRAFKAKVTFVKDADGKVTGLRLSQNGRDIEGKRIK